MFQNVPEFWEFTIAVCTDVLLQHTFTLISHSEKPSFRRAVIRVLPVGEKEDFFTRILSLIYYSNTVTMAANLAIRKVFRP